MKTKGMELLAVADVLLQAVRMSDDNTYVWGVWAELCKVSGFMGYGNGRAPKITSHWRESLISSDLVSQRKLVFDAGLRK